MGPKDWKRNGNSLPVSRETLCEKEAHLTRGIDGLLASNAVRV